MLSPYIGLLDDRLYPGIWPPVLLPSNLTYCYFHTPPVAQRTHGSCLPGSGPVLRCPAGQSLPGQVGWSRVPPAAATTCVASCRPSCGMRAGRTGRTSRSSDRDQTKRRVRAGGLSGTHHQPVNVGDESDDDSRPGGACCLLSRPREPRLLLLANPHAAQRADTAESLNRSAAGPGFCLGVPWSFAHEGGGKHPARLPAASVLRDDAAVSHPSLPFCRPFHAAHARAPHAHRECPAVATGNDHMSGPPLLSLGSQHGL